MSMVTVVSHADAATKKQARRIVQQEVRAGRLTRPHNCSYCGRLARRIHAHHEDYSQPLLIEWLCTKCHGTRHSRIVQMVRFAFDVLGYPQDKGVANG